MGWFQRPWLIIAILALAVPGLALAWGATGHRLIAQLAIRALPPEVPAFLRDAAVEVGELSREPDRSRGSGDPHDADLDPGHFINLDGSGRAGGAVALDALPGSREAFDDRLAKTGEASDNTGYLPYAMAGAWQQVVTDFAYWRICVHGEKHAATPEIRAWFAADRLRREALILRDAGVYAHYVADGSQPLHVTGHHNGWQGANPRGFTTNRLHSWVEGAFVRRFIGEAAVAGRMRPYRARKGRPLQAAAAYLGESFAQVEPLYELHKAGGYEDGDPRGVAFSAERLAAGAAETRDRLLDAWRASAKAKVGYPAVSVADVEAGLVDPYPSLFGKD